MIWLAFELKYQQLLIRIQGYAFKSDRNMGCWIEQAFLLWQSPLTFPIIVCLLIKKTSHASSLRIPVCFLIANCQCQYYIYVFLNFYKDHYNVVGEYSSHYTISCEFNHLSQRCCWTALWWFYWSRTCVSLRGECTPQVSWGLHIPFLQTQGLPHSCYIRGGLQSHPATDIKKVTTAGGENETGRVSLFGS